MRKSPPTAPENHSATVVAFKCGRFSLRCTKMRRHRGGVVNPTVACAGYALRFTKSRQQRQTHKPERTSRLPPKLRCLAPVLPSTNSLCADNFQMANNMDTEATNEFKVWPPHVELAFIQLLVAEVNKDSTLTKKNTFSMRHYAQIAEQLQLLGVKYTTAQLKQKYQRIRQSYNAFVKLKNHTSFGWDEAKQIVTASDDVWDAYVKANPKAKQFRRKGLPNMDLLDILFANSQAIGSLAHASTQPSLDSDEEREMQNAFFNDHTTSTPDASPIGDESQAPTRNIDEVGGSRDCGRKRTYVDRAIETWTQTNMARMEYYVRKTKAVEASTDHLRYSMEVCQAYLETMEGITPIQYVKACEQFLHRQTRKMFMGMPPEMRMVWVQGLE